MAAPTALSILTSSSTGACSGSSPEAIAPRIWCTRSHGSWAHSTCRCRRVHQIAWIMVALDLPLPSAAYMSGGVFSEKDGREVPDTIAVTLDFPKDIVDR